MSEPETRPPRAGETVLNAAAPWDAGGIARARAQVREGLGTLDLPGDLIRHAELVASELVTNAVRHGAPPLGLAVVAVGSGIRIEVRDASPLPPVPLTVAHPAADGGRGLGIVDAVSARWGHYREGAGKCVWSELDSALTG